jgi:electron transfer flavoprotein alpha subunit
VTCELDDGWRRAEVSLPAVLSTAERLIEPCKVEPLGRAAVESLRLRRLTAAELGSRPWGASASATLVTGVRTIEVSRRHQLLSGPIEDQVAKAVRLLLKWGALDAASNPGMDPLSTRVAETAGIGPAVASPRSSRDETNAPPLVVVVLEPGQDRMGRELLGEAAELADHMDGEVVALGSELGDPVDLARWGADRAVRLAGVSAAEDAAAAVGPWCEENRPWALLAAGTLWGREVASRVSVRTMAGLTGDAVGLGVENGRLVALKPAFGGRLVAVIEATSALQMATVRPGILALRPPRSAGAAIPVEVLGIQGRDRTRVLEEGKDDDVEALVGARIVVGVGQGVLPDRYPALEPLRKLLGAQLAATRKVTDRGWLPRSRQVGITGHSIAPSLYVAIGISGKFNHMVGVGAAGTVLVVNSDPQAAAFEWADLGIVGDWEKVIPLLVEEVRRATPALAIAPLA